MKNKDIREKKDNKKKRKKRDFIIVHIFILNHPHMI